MIQKIIKAKCSSKTARHTGCSKAITMAAVATLMLVTLNGCSKNNPEGAQAPAPVVGVVTVEPTTVTLDTELSGRLQPIREAQVVARATGVVQKRLFTEGSYVK